MGLVRRVFREKLVRQTRAYSERSVCVCVWYFGDEVHTLRARQHVARYRKIATQHRIAIN